MATVSNIKVQASKPARHTQVTPTALSLVGQTRPQNSRIAQSDETDALLKTIVDATSSNALVLDDLGTIVYATESWSSFAKSHELPNKHFQDCLNLAGKPACGTKEPTLADDIAHLGTGASQQFEGEYCYRGVTRPVHFRVAGTKLQLGEPGRPKILLTYKDTASPLDALRKTEQRLSQLVEKTSIVVWEAEADPLRFTYVNDQAINIFGYSLSKWYESDFLALHIHPDDRQRVLSDFSRQSQKADQYDFTFRLLSKDGSVIWVHNLVSVTRVGSERHLRGFMIDITDRKCAEEALRDLGGRLIAAQEEERSRIARELHDDLNQRMALLSIELEQFRQDIDKPVNLRKRVKVMQKQAQDISTDSHRLSYQLHPSKLDHLGLGAAVKSLCEELSKSGNVKIDLRQQGFPATLPRDVTLSVFRVAQEALRNCIKHSGATAAQVVLERKANGLRLSISDNGCGFDMHSPRLKKGLGFISMAERIHLVRGEIATYSQPECGTRIEVSVPLRQDKAIFTE